MADDVRIELIGNLDDEVRKLPELIAASQDAAAAVAAAARSLAPVAEGNYLDGITVQQTKAGARVLASDPKSSVIEFGWPRGNIPAHFVLRRAVEAVGLKFKKRG